eukprot:1516430-Amphidinium_carterae.1
MVEVFARRLGNLLARTHGQHAVCARSYLGDHPTHSADIYTFECFSPRTAVPLGFEPRGMSEVKQERRCESYESSGLIRLIRWVLKLPMKSQHEGHDPVGSLRYGARCNAAQLRR